MRENLINGFVWGALHFERAATPCGKFPHRHQRAGLTTFSRPRANRIGSLFLKTKKYEGVYISDVVSYSCTNLVIDTMVPDTVKKNYKFYVWYFREPLTYFLKLHRDVPPVTVKPHHRVNWQTVPILAALWLGESEIENLLWCHYGLDWMLCVVNLVNIVFRPTRVKDILENNFIPVL